MRTVFILLFSVLLMTAQSSVMASQCAAVFPDGASTHGDGGTIFFGYNSQLIASDDNQLATTSISKNGGSNKNTCNTADCVATGTASEPASSIIFQSTASTVDVTLGYQDSVVLGSGSFSGNAFDDINPGSASEASITFSDTHDEYFVDSLVLAFYNTLYLQAGATYWINQLTLSSQAQIIVLGSGTAHVYVNQELSFPSPGLINSPSINNSGDASKLVVYAFSNVTFNNNSTFTGSLYTKGDLILGSSSYAFGAVSAANIELGTESTITYQSEEIAETDFGNFCESPPPPPPQCQVTNGFINAVGIKIDSAGSDPQINTTTEALAIHGAWLAAGSPVSGLIDNGTYNIAASGSREVDRLDFGGSDNDFTGTLPYPGADAGVSGPDFLVQTSGTLSLPAGDYTIFVESDDGFSFVMDTLSGDTVSFNKFGSSSSGASNELRFENQTGNANTGGSFTLSQNSVFNLSAIFFERDGSNFLEISIANSIKTSAAPAGYEVLRHGALSDKVKFGRCPQSIVLEYHFDELSWDGTPNEILDNTSYNNHGTAQGALNTSNNTPAIAGLMGTCSYGEFDGVDDYVAMGNPDALNFSGEITLAAWIRPDGLSDHMNIIAHGLHVDPNQEIIFRIHDGHYQVGVWDGSEHLASSIIPEGDVGLGNWVHLAGTYDGTTWRLFRNGVELSTVTDPNGALLVAADWAIGANGAGTGNFFEGGIDEPRIYSEALTASEISALMNETRTCPHPPAPLCAADGDSLYAIGIKINNSGSDTQINTTTEALAIHGAWLAAGSPVSGLIDNDTYNIAASGSREVDRLDFGGSDNDFTGTLPYPGADAGVSGPDFLVHTSGTLSLPAGDYTIFVESDDGFSFVMDTLSGDTVSFNKFGSSSSGASNELRFEDQTGNANTGGSFTLSKNSVFDISAIFFERAGSNFLEISIANDIRTNAAPSGYEVLRHGALSDKVKFGRCADTFQVDHYRIQHNDGQGFTCEAKTLTIKACADESCDTLYDQETLLTLSPSGWKEGDSFSFTGELITTLSVTDEGTFTLAKKTASPDENLRCFNVGTEVSCDIDFVNSGFEFIGATESVKSLSDQIAEMNFSDVNLRAVKDDGSGACVSLLDDGSREVDLSFDCIEPGTCKIPLLHDSTPLNELESASISLNFTDGVASLSEFNYKDAGRLQLSAQALIDGVTITSGSAQVDVVPASLKLAVIPITLNYTGSADTHTYTAGADFTLTLGAYGANDTLLGNYVQGLLQVDMTRVAPTADGAVDGVFTYAFDETSEEGVYSYTASYDEVGRIALTVEDSNYLPDDNNPTSIINGQASLTLGNFIPGFFEIVQNSPNLVNTCNDFSYVGQYVPMNESLTYTVTARNALGNATRNYGGNNLENLDNDWWDLTLSSDHVLYTDNSGNDGEFFGFMHVTNTENYDGSGTFTVTKPIGGEFDSYSTPLIKIPKTTTLLSEYFANFDLMLSNKTIGEVATIADDNDVCYKLNYDDALCLALPENNITGAKLRYGRLTLTSTYGPETEPLNVPIKAEYFNAGQWLLNTDDSNCTSIDFTEQSNQIRLSNTGFADSFNTVTSTGVLIEGVPVGNQFTLDAPDTRGELNIWLDPAAVDVTWPTYLNYDWNGDGFINGDDFPEATVTFGQFRGNDRIIHWREVFN